MDLSILKQIFERNDYAIHDSFCSWEEAVKASVAPLIQNGRVKEEYAERVLSMVKEYGPYICICPHVAIPHAMAPELVLSDTSCISFMKVNKPVVFGESEVEKSELFFALAAPSGQKHLEELQEIANMLEQEGVIEALLEAKTEADFRTLLNL